MRISWFADANGAGSGSAVHSDPGKAHAPKPAPGHIDKPTTWSTLPTSPRARTAPLRLGTINHALKLVDAARKAERTAAAWVTQDKTNSTAAGQVPSPHFDQPLKAPEGATKELKDLVERTNKFVEERQRLVEKTNRSLKRSNEILEEVHKGALKRLGSAIVGLERAIRDETERLSRPSAFGNGLKNPGDLSEVGERLRQLYLESPDEEREIRSALKLNQADRVRKELAVLSEAMKRGNLSPPQQKEKQAFIADAVNWVSEPGVTDGTSVKDKQFSRLKELVDLSQKKRLHPDLFAALVIQCAKGMKIIGDNNAISLIDLYRLNTIVENAAPDQKQALKAALKL